MPWKGNHDNGAQGSHREWLALLKLMSALKVRAGGFPNSSPAPTAWPCRGQNTTKWTGEFSRTLFMCLPELLHPSVIFKKLFSLVRNTDMLDGSKRLLELTEHYGMVKCQGSGSRCFGFKSHPPTPTYTLATLPISFGSQFHAMNPIQTPRWPRSQVLSHMELSLKSGSTT